MTTGSEFLPDDERRLESIASELLTDAGVQVQAQLALADVRAVLRNTGTDHLAFKRQRKESA